MTICPLTNNFFANLFAYVAFICTLFYFHKKKDDDLRMMTQGKYGDIGALIQQREVPIQQAGTPAYPGIDGQGGFRG